MDDLHFFQIGCGRNADYARLVKDNWFKHFDFDNIPPETKWHGVLVDLQPASINEMIKQFIGNERLDILNVAVGSEAGFLMVGGRDFSKVDSQARLTSASRYNDWMVDDFADWFYCHTITLDQLFGFMGADDEIGLLAMDVQGSEVDILSNYSWRLKPIWIEFEPHSPEGLDIVSDILDRNGYSLVRRTPDGRRERFLWTIKTK